MAGNYGKYTDRSPIICPAGKVSGDPAQNISTCFQEFPINDQIDALKHDAQLWMGESFVPPTKLPPIQNAHFRGRNTEISAVLSPPVLTRYQQLIGDLKDTPYSSYWNKEIGKPRDPVQGLPAGLDRINTTFGKPTIKGIPVKELVNPSKGFYEVLKESQVGHEMYKKTHNDFNPSERINRGYTVPPYDENKRLGGKSKYDPRGIWVKCACDWYKKEPITYASKLQADFATRTKPLLGKVLAPNENIKCVPNGHAFGTPSKRDFYELPDLLKDPNVSPCVFKKNLNEWLASLNKLRLLVKKRRNQGFSLDALYKKALFLDKERTGLIPLQEFRELCACDYITISKELECLCAYFNYLVNDKIDYKSFINLIDINKDLFGFQPINDLPKESKYYLTTNQAAQCDYLFIDNSEMAKAGLPSIRHDLPRPEVPQGECRAAIDNLGADTSAKAVLNPNMYTNYGLSYRDFFLPRTAEVIRSLFEKLGYNFRGDNFEKLWQMGVQQDQTGLVCIDTFKRLLQTQCGSLELKVDEKQIDKCEPVQLN